MISIKKLGKAGGSTHLPSGITMIDNVKKSLRVHSLNDLLCEGFATFRTVRFGQVNNGEVCPIDLGTVRKEVLSKTSVDCLRCSFVTGGGTYSGSSPAVLDRLEKDDFATSRSRVNGKKKRRRKRPGARTWLDICELR